jgi:hypothetical protein
LRIELVTDLTQARSDGAPLDELLSIDPDRFAIDVAIAHDIDIDHHASGVGVSTSPEPREAHERSRRRGRRGCRPLIRDVVVAGIVGSVVGGLTSMVLVLTLMGWIMQHTRDGSMAESAAMLATYAGAATIAALGGGLAVTIACGDTPHPRRLGLRTALGLLVSGAVAAIVTVTFAETTDYSTRTPVVLTEVGLVLAVCGLGLTVVARTTNASPDNAASGQA